MSTTHRTFGLFAYVPIGIGYNHRKDVREKRLTSGIALQAHINAQHSGEIVSTCPACIEIQRKQLAAQK